MTAVVLRGDAAHLPLPDASVDLIVTSPPYWSMRSYRDNGEHYAGQIGSEETPGEYITNLLTCTREWMRVLKPGGSIFVNVGDGYRDKSLLFLPEQYRIGCVAKLGLIARAKIVWSKTNHKPESADDRVCVAHEDVVHLVKQLRYFTAIDEIREPVSADRHTLSRRDRTDRRLAAANAGQTSAVNPLGKLPGSVWEIPTVPLLVPDRIAHARCCQGRKQPGCNGLDHHAAFPFELPGRIILGWSPSGICVECGEGRCPVSVRERPSNDRGRIELAAEGFTRRLGATSGLRTNATAGEYPPTVITGYACACTPYTDRPGTGERTGPTQAASIAAGAYPLNSGGKPRDTSHPGHAGLWGRRRSARGVSIT